MTDNSEVQTIHSPLSKSTHNMEGKYVIFMETSGKEFESWYYFIRYEGNEEALKHLQEQLQKIEWFIIDDLSTFDLDLEHFISAVTAKELTKVELNSYSFHRKFDGKLKMIDFNFTKKDMKHNDRMICKVFDILGYGQIEDYVSDEDLDDEDLTENSSSDDDSSSESSSDSDGIKKKFNDKVPLPSSLLKNDNLPRFAKRKQRASK